MAEGTRLLSEYGDQTPSRVRIPPSPYRGASVIDTPGPLSVCAPGARLADFEEAYLALIAPFRHLVVYPALMRHIEHAWNARAA